MRIIEHGDKFELGEVTCCNCHCKFAYNKSDIEIQHIKEWDTYDRDEYDINIVVCPECKITLTLKGERP